MIGRVEDKVAVDEDNIRSLNPKESDALLQCLPIPDDLKVTSENLQKFLSQESPKAIIDRSKKPKMKTMIKFAQITDKPSLKTKRKVKPFDVVIHSGDSKRVIKVDMVREIEENESARSMEITEDQEPGPSGLQDVENAEGGNRETNEGASEQEQYNSLESTRFLTETCGALSGCRSRGS